MKQYAGQAGLVALPLVLAGLNSNWIFTPPKGNIPDPWFYLAYFRNLYKLAPAFPSITRYFIDRVTWNVPGYWVYHLFPPVTANYVLHLAVYYTAVFSLFGILSILFNRRTALVSALLMGSYPWFLRAAGWDYLDGLGLAQMLLLLYLLTVGAHSSRWKQWLFLAGLVHASLIITNIFWIGFAPSWIVFFRLLNRKTGTIPRTQMISAANVFLVGHVPAVVVADLLFCSATGEYDLLARSLMFTFAASLDPQFGVHVAATVGYLAPYWHVLPVVVALAAAWRLGQKRSRERNDAFIAVTALFAFACGWMVFWQLIGSPCLTIFYYGSCLIPVVFLLLGALLSDTLEGLSRQQFGLSVVTAAVVLAAPFALVVIYPPMEQWQGAVVPILALGMLLLAALGLGPGKALLLLIFVCCSALSFLGAQDALLYYPDRFRCRDNFNAVLEASQAIDGYYPDHHYLDFRLWFLPDENTDTYVSLASLYFYPWGSAINRQKSASELFSFPTKVKLKNGNNIVVVSSRTDQKAIWAEVERDLVNPHQTLQLRSVKPIRQGYLGFTLYFTRVVAKPVQ